MSQGDEHLLIQETRALQRESLLSFDLNNINLVTHGNWHWGGRADAALVCDVGFTANAVVIVGELQDDIPFVQFSDQPIVEINAQTHYRADCVEFILEDLTSATQRIRFALDYGSACTRPRIMLYESVSPEPPGCIKDAFCRVIPAVPPATTKFEIAIPYDSLGDPRFFNRPFKVTCRMHDIDGNPNTYKRLEQTKTKR